MTILFMYISALYFTNFASFGVFFFSRNKPRRITLSQIVPLDKRETTVFCLKEITDLNIYVKNTKIQITQAMDVSFAFFFSFFNAIIN